MIKFQIIIGAALSATSAVALPDCVFHVLRNVTVNYVRNGDIVTNDPADYQRQLEQNSRRGSGPRRAGFEQARVRRLRADAVNITRKIAPIGWSHFSLVFIKKPKFYSEADEIYHFTSFIPLQKG